MGRGRLFRKAFGEGISKATVVRVEKKGGKSRLGEGKISKRGVPERSRHAPELKGRGRRREYMLPGTVNFEDRKIQPRNKSPRKTQESFVTEGGRLEVDEGEGPSGSSHIVKTRIERQQHRGGKSEIW